MKYILQLICMILVFASCNNSPKTSPIIGTWQLISAITIEQDSSYSTFNPNVKMIKIINPTHFAFLSHDLSGGKDSLTAAFTAGGGKYTLSDSVYTEYLDYFIHREWENNKFEFVVNVANDTLTQKGIEKIEKLGVDHIIIEKYARVVEK